MTAHRILACALLALHALALGCNTPAKPSSAEPAAPHAHVHEAAQTQAAAPDEGAAAASEHCAHAEPMQAGTALPGASLYNLDAKLTDQHGTELTLSSFRGEPVFVAMFYASCTSICPMLIGHLQTVESTLPEAARAKTKLLLVSLDPARDSVEKLAELAKRHGVDETRWHFTRTSEASVQEIAAVLGVRYRRMPDGEISHSPTVALLDRDGVIVKRADVPQRDPGELGRPLLALLGHDAGEATPAQPPSATAAPQPAP